MLKSALALTYQITLLKPTAVPSTPSKYHTSQTYEQTLVCID